MVTEDFPGSAAGAARKEGNMDNKAYQKMDYALCLLSAAADGRNHGCIVNSFHQVTSSFPPKFTVAVNKDHETCKAVQAAGSFSVTLLDADAPAELIDTFGYKSGRVADKFAGREVQTDGSGNPYLKEHMVSALPARWWTGWRSAAISCLWVRLRRRRSWGTGRC